MLARLRHRGPDGCGQWRSASTATVLGHIRLAIFDGSPAAAQPMTAADGRLAITYNGAIYNYRALRDTLEASGCRFASNSDTEVILHGYHHYGEAIVDRLRGMYAFVIWDDLQRQAFLARDRFGIKPLYYSEVDDGIVFASELRALSASGLLAPDPDPSAVYEYFRRGSVPEPRTLLASARMLPAGATAVWNSGRLAVRPFKSAPTAALSTDGVAACDRVRSALQQSVDAHFAGEAPVGVLLSGGMDSASIVALARAEGRDFPTLSLSFPGTTADERTDAVRSAEHFGVDHAVLEVDAGTARGALDDYLATIDQPSIDGLNSFMAVRLARQYGVRVLLSGIGADELFGGYESFWRVPSMERWHRLAAVSGPLARRVGAWLETASDVKVRRIGDLLQQPPSIVTAYRAFRGIFTRHEARILTQHFIGFDSAADAYGSGSDSDGIEGVFELELDGYVRNQLLRDADVMGMSSGVELRTPFLDKELLAVLSTLPTSTRLQRGKALLAEAVPELPPWTTAQPKRSFQLPFESWAQDRGWAEVFDALEQRSPVPLLTWYRKWCLMTFERALRNMNEVTPV